MHAWQKTLKSVYLDPEIDKALDARAEAEGVTKGALVRAYIEAGLCLPSSCLPPFEGEEPIFAPPESRTPRILRTFYMTFDLGSAVASRASSERIGSSPLIERFCAEGLARPLSGGVIALQAKQRLVEEHKLKIEELGRIAHDAYVAYDDAITEFMKICPHLDLAGNLPLAACPDCGAIISRP